MCVALKIYFGIILFVMPFKEGLNLAWFLTSLGGVMLFLSGIKDLAALIGGGNTNSTCPHPKTPAGPPGRRP